MVGRLPPAGNPRATPVDFFLRQHRGYWRLSLSAKLGTMKDARKIGRNLFPVHRKATVSPSAASKAGFGWSFGHCELAQCDSRYDWYLDRDVISSDPAL